MDLFKLPKLRPHSVWLNPIFWRWSTDIRSSYSSQVYRQYWESQMCWVWGFVFHLSFLFTVFRYTHLCAQKKVQRLWKTRVILFLSIWSPGQLSLQLSLYISVAQFRSYLIVWVCSLCLLVYCFQWHAFLFIPWRLFIQLGFLFLGNSSSQIRLHIGAIWIHSKRFKFLFLFFCSRVQRAENIFNTLQVVLLHTKVENHFPKAFY